MTRAWILAAVLGATSVAMAEPAATTQPAAASDVDTVVALRVAFLVKALENPDWRFRDNVARELGEIGPPAQPAIGSLKAALTDKAWQVRRRAIQAMLKIEPRGKNYRDDVAALIGDENQWVRLAAAEIVSRTGDPATGVPVLTKAVESPSRFVRLEAILALGRIGPPAASAAEVVSEKPRVDRDGAIRAAATWALRRMEPKKTR